MEFPLSLLMIALDLGMWYNSRPMRYKKRQIKSSEKDFSSLDISRPRWTAQNFSSHLATTEEASVQTKWTC